MCGCETCVIFKNMYQCLLLWRKKNVKRNKQIIAKMDDGPEKIKLEKDLEEYKTYLSKAGAVCDAASHIGCEKVEIGGCMFPCFSCVMGKCGNCPNWDNIIQRSER